MDRNREGRLTSIEHDELKAVTAHNEALTLLSTEALLQSTYPELFSPTGRLNRKRLCRLLGKIRPGSQVARWQS